MSLKLSIIVPVYNVETYLTECLNSLAGQSFADMEVICVNDGSTDSSLRILNSFAERDSRFRVIDKENSGYGASMNCGLAAAGGEYIGFLESDDFAVPEVYRTLYDKAKELDADVVKGNYYFYYTENRQSVYMENMSGFPYDTLLNRDGNEALFFVGPSVWSGLYKRSFLEENGIRFLESPGASYQDTGFAIKVWACAQTIVLQNIPVIYYRQDNMNSSSNESRKVFHICGEYVEALRFLAERQIHDLMPVILKARHLSYVWNIDRLKPVDKLKFFMMIQKQYEDAFQKGEFVRKYWKDEEWILIHQIVFDPDRAFRKLCKQERREEGEEEREKRERVLKWMRCIYPIYIYGAGKYGRQLLQNLERDCIRVDGFIVSDVKENDLYCEGLPVIGIEEADKDALILLGVSGRYEGEITEMLDQNGFMNYMNYPDI